jgi:rhodanese-related sulfurtransferase
MLNITKFFAITLSITSFIAEPVFAQPVDNLLKPDVTKQVTSHLTPQISQQELLSLNDSEVEFIVLDVRTKEEYDQGHVPNAINVSHTDVKDQLNSLLAYKNKKVIVYCRSGKRAAMAERILSNSGFSDLWHLKGDMNGWKEANLPVVITPESSDKS